MGPDFAARLTVDRLKFMMKNIGAFKIMIKTLGHDDWTVLKEITPANYYEADTLPFTDEVMVETPLHQVNTNFKMKLISDSPYPVTLNKLMWEGNYSPRYYRRA